MRALDGLKTPERIGSLRVLIQKPGTLKDSFSPTACLLALKFTAAVGVFTWAYFFVFCDFSGGF